METKKEGLIKFTNRKLIEHWRENGDYWAARFMVVVSFVIYPITLLIAWSVREES